jgi:hypothetical protein
MLERLGFAKHCPWMPTPLSLDPGDTVSTTWQLTVPLHRTNQVRVSRLDCAMTTIGTALALPLSPVCERTSRFGACLLWTSSETAVALWLADRFHQEEVSVSAFEVNCIVVSPGSQGRRGRSLGACSGRV